MLRLGTSLLLQVRFHGRIHPQPCAHTSQTPLQLPPYSGCFITTGGSQGPAVALAIVLKCLSLGPAFVFRRSECDGDRSQKRGLEPSTCSAVLPKTAQCQHECQLELKKRVMLAGVGGGPEAQIPEETPPRLLLLSVSVLSLLKGVMTCRPSRSFLPLTSLGGGTHQGALCGLTHRAILTPVWGLLSSCWLFPQAGGGGMRPDGGGRILCSHPRLAYLAWVAFFPQTHLLEEPWYSTYDVLWELTCSGIWFQKHCSS